MKRLILAPLVFSAFLLMGGVAHAAAPTLALSLSSDRDTVQIRVTADPRADITLHYTNSIGDDKALKLGTADTDGYLVKNVATAANKIVFGSQVYIASSVSGASSPKLKWPIPDSSIVFDMPTLPLPLGNSTSVSPIGAIYGTLYIKSNSNTSAVSASLSGSAIDLLGKQVGSAAVVVCITGSSSSCGTLTVVVGASSAAPAALSLSQSSPVIVVGKSTIVYITGLLKPSHVSSNSNPAVAQANITSNAISLIGNKIGSTKIVICNSAELCGTLAVSVIAGDTSSGEPVVNKDTLSLDAGESGTVLVAGADSFTAKSNNPSIASTTVLGGTHVIVAALKAGKATITICKSSDKSQCAFVSVAVSAARAPTPAPAPAPAPSLYVFTQFLTVGSTGTEVTALQKRLQTLGVYTGPITGTFGALTRAGVIKFQTAHHISAVGYVGPATRAALSVQ